MKKIALSLVAALALSGCTLSTIPVPTELSASPKLKVSGRQGFNPKKKLSFGPFSTGPVDRSPTYLEERARILSITGIFDQTYAFVLLDHDEQAAYVDCWNDARATNIDAPVLGQITTYGRASLFCEIRPAADTMNVWRLDLESNRGGAFRGALRADGDRFEVEGTRDLADNPFNPTIETTGLYFRREGRAVGAVELVNHGGVWLNDEDVSPEERSVLAAAAAALLAFESLADDYGDDFHASNVRRPGRSIPERVLAGVKERVDASNNPPGRQ